MAQPNVTVSDGDTQCITDTVSCPTHRPITPPSQSSTLQNTAGYGVFSTATTSLFLWKISVLPEPSTIRAELCDSIQRPSLICLAVYEGRSGDLKTEYEDAPKSIFTPGLSLRKETNLLHVTPVDQSPTITSFVNVSGASSSIG